MRLVLHQSTLEKAIELVNAAQERGREVEKLIVSPGEWESILNCPVGPGKDDPTGQKSCWKDGELYVMGVQVVVEGRSDTTPVLARAAEKSA